MFQKKKILFPFRDSWRLFETFPGFARGERRMLQFPRVSFQDLYGLFEYSTSLCAPLQDCSKLSGQILRIAQILWTIFRFQEAFRINWKSVMGNENKIRGAFSFSHWILFNIFQRVTWCEKKHTKTKYKKTTTASSFWGLLSIVLIFSSDPFELIQDSLAPVQNFNLTFMETRKCSRTYSFVLS